jgi:lactate dehydrogenase-like 2-hydroxyacid dehydrogenase
MNKFNKIVAIEPVSLIPEYEEKLKTLADEVVMYGDIPTDDDVIANRIGDADCVLLSYTSRLTADAMAKCPNIKYVGMCCSLYSPESANVDIRYAEAHGIKVTGIRDYGDEGVVEYVVSELVRCLHGFGQPSWETMPREITGLKVGVVGLGKSGGMIADAMKFFGAEIAYFARGEKQAAAEKGYRFMPLQDLMEWSDVVFCCLNKNTVLLHEEEFRRLGNHKILFNTGLSPAWDEVPFLKWLEEDNLCYCDTLGALGGEQLLAHPHVRCVNVSTGRTSQAFVRLSEKVLANVEEYLGVRL